MMKDPEQVCHVSKSKKHKFIIVCVNCSYTREFKK